MNIIIRTFEGFEEVLAEEVFHITEIKPEIGKRAVYIKGDLRTIYNLNLRSRLALDVLVELHKYKASNESQLYKGAESFDWGNEVSIHETFSISSIVHSPFFNHSKYVSLKIKDAIIRYSNVGKADTCDELWSGCDEVKGQLKNQSQVHGVIGVALCKPADEDKEGTCEDLGYPGNPTPF